VAQQSGRQRLGTPERAGQHRVTYIEIDEILDSSRVDQNFVDLAGWADQRREGIGTGVTR